MTTLREAAQQALEALEYHVEQTRSIWKTSQAIDALRAALAQEEQELVAYRHSHDGEWEYYDAPTGEDCAGCQPLYTHPPRREWQWLTEEEMYGLYRRAGLEAYYPMDNLVQGDYSRKIGAYGRAIEQALKEKNNG